MKIKGIEISAGHRKEINSGADGLINEVVESRKVAQRVSTLLKLRYVPTTYYEDNVTKNQKDNINHLVAHHNKDVNDLVVSFHFNSSGAVTEKGVGVEVLYYNQKSIAHVVSKAISESTNGGLKNRGAKYRDDLGILLRTKEPSILIEVCFVNSKHDVKVYKENFEKICVSIVDALEKIVR